MCPMNKSQNYKWKPKVKLQNDIKKQFILCLKHKNNSSLEKYPTVVKA